MRVDVAAGKPLVGVELIPAALVQLAKVNLSFIAGEISAGSRMRQYITRLESLLVRCFLEHKILRESSTRIGNMETGEINLSFVNISARVIILSFADQPVDTCVLHFLH